MSKSSQVQKQTKSLPYSVSIIGDKVALDFWKESRRLKDQQYRAEARLRLADRREKAVTYVQDQSYNPFKLSDDEREEINARRRRLASERDRLKAHAQVKLAEKRMEAFREACNTPIREAQPAPPTLLDRIRNFFKV